jgi:hypothetical protein
MDRHPHTLGRRELIAWGGAAALLAPLPTTARSQEELLRVRDLYEKDMSFSELAQDLAGQRIDVQGFMAPPLKAESRFFVLTRRPMAVCPFCETEADWPDDILAVYTKRVIDVVPFNVLVLTQGVLDLGGFKDPETGFVSRVRLMDSTYARAA